MDKSLKNKLLAILASVFLLLSATCVITFSNTNAKIAKAEDIDYSIQGYQNFEGSVDEDYIYKIHCADIRSVHGIDKIKEYVTRIQFKESAGCAIYFVNGVACNYEDVNDTDFETSKYSECYEILHYDEKNNYVYIKFKNFDKIEAGEIGNAEIGQISITQESSLYLNRPQRVAISNIVNDYSEVVENSFYFNAGAMQYADDLGSIYFRLNYNAQTLQGEWSVDKITISFDTEDGLMENCEIEKKELLLSDFETTNETTQFIDIKVSPDTFVKSVALKAVVDYSCGGNKYIFEYKSIDRSIMQIWKSMEASSELENNYSEAAVYSIQRYIAADKDGFNIKTKTSTFLQLAGGYNEQTRLYSYKVVDGAYVYKFSAQENFTFFLRIASSEYTGEIPFVFDVNMLALSPSSMAAESIDIIEKCSVWFENGQLYFSFAGMNELTYINDVQIRTDRETVLTAITPIDTDYINELLSQIEEWKQKYEEEAAKVTQAEEKVISYKNEVATLKSEIIQLNATVLAKENEINNLKAEKESLETQLAQKEEEIQTLQNSLSATTNNYNAAAAELEAKKIEYNKLKADYDEVCAAQSGDVQAMTATVRKLRTEIAEKEAKIEELETKVAELEKENESLKSQNGSVSFGCGSIGNSGGNSGGNAILISTLLLCAAMIMGGRIYARKRKTN